MKNTLYLFLMSVLILFTACKNETKQEGPTKEEIKIEESNININPSHAQIGLNIAFTTKAQLGKNLIGTMKEKGVLEALQFCNIKAIPLTDSMATVHQAIIKRVSDKTRNPNNKANEVELKNIEYFKSVLAKNEEIKPIVETSNDSVNFYYPIVTNAMCLQCHGNPEKDLNPELLTSLSNLYPNDEAVGYSENQVRGIWSIQFKNNKIDE
tara:strand:- start:44557 stop:45186 length:630 start_codon:yes stop_codon:yes gene_type:complete